MGRLRILRTSYLWFVLVPILAQCLAKIDRELVITILDHKFTIIADLPFSWKAFFFSAVFFAAATAIYSFWCPEIIRDYRNFEHYKQDGESQLQLKIPIARHATITGTNDDLVTFAQQFCSGNGQLSPHTLLTDFEIDTRKMPDAFQFVRSVTSMWNWPARFICAACYGIGYLFLLWVSVRTILFVILFTVERASS
jgi:hypothetical protein